MKLWFLYDKHKERFFIDHVKAPFFGDCPHCHSETWSNHSISDFDENFHIKVICDRCNREIHAVLEP